MYYAYVLKSKKDGKYYIGSTTDVETRLRYHNAGVNKSTCHRRPFEIVFTRSFDSKVEAQKFERLLKKQKGGIGFKRLTMLE